LPLPEVQEQDRRSRLMRSRRCSNFSSMNGPGEGT
jgi:hypothetical protein